MRKIRCMCSFLLCFALFVSMMGSLCTPAAASQLPFTDIGSDNYVDAIYYVYNEGIMNGTSPTTFEPDTLFDRAMFVTTLYRMSGSTRKIKPTGFTDVSSSSYYYYAVGWAQQYGIVNGVSKTSFAPNQYITSEQALTILYRYATKYLGESYDIPNPYIIPSSMKVSGWAKIAVTWALNCGIPDVLPSGFNPTSTMSRELAADYLFRFETLALGNGKATAITSLSPSTTEKICDIMNDMGYDATYHYDLRPHELEFALRNSSIIYTHSHGLEGGTGVALKEEKETDRKEECLTSSDIDKGSLSHVDLVYVSACQAGKVFAKTLVDVGGADVAVGFLLNVSAPSETGGIHYYNQFFMKYYANGESLVECRNSALKDLKKKYGESNTYGAKSCVIYQ